MIKQIAVTIGFLFCLPVYLQAGEWHDHAGWNLIAGFETLDIENSADWHEPDWSRWLVERSGEQPFRGENIEVYTRAGKKIDILTDDEAIEVEWALKWFESIGQSVFYGLETNRQPAVILLSRDTEKEQDEIELCGKVCAKVGIRLYVQIVPGKE